MQYRITSCYKVILMSHISFGYLSRLFLSLCSTPNSQSGFTLVELMIVVVIIGILSTIAIPSYFLYVSKAQSNACLSEVKSYSNDILYILNDQDDSTSPSSPTISTCMSITNATGWTLETQQKIIAIAKPPSNARIECDIPNGSPCRILP